MDSLWSTFHSITSIKRRELEKQRDACKALRLELLGPVDAETDGRVRVRMLLRDAGKRSLSSNETSGRRREQRLSEVVPQKESTQHDEILTLADISALNVQRFLQQSEYDASIPPAYFSAIEQRFREALCALEIKYKYATLFSDLVTERSAPQLEAVKTSSWEAVGRKEMYDQRIEWESLVFTPSTVEQKSIISALEAVFNTPEALQSLDQLRKSVVELCHRIQFEKSNVDEMKTVVNGLIASDLLSDDQNDVLKQVRNNPTWLSEMVDVLNLRLASIERWTWGTEAMTLEMRRQLNGRFRVFMQEEITQALLIYHVGINFASSFARIFDDFYHSIGWKKHSGVGRPDQAKWDYFIGKDRAKQNRSIRTELSKSYRKDYFLSVLPRQNEEGEGGYGDDALRETVSQSRVSKSVDAKQRLFHLLVSESLIADQLEEELVVLQTDFRWFGPSLSHATIQAVLKMFGVTSVWLSFFEKFLHAPLRFGGDGPNSAIRRRERGVPMSHVLSSFFGEATLFCLDFAVNEATGGKPMFRMHDDVWLWGTVEEMRAAWNALFTLSKLMGITINEDKTGSARLTRNRVLAAKPLPKSLPSGSLHWGLLSAKDGSHFTIDQVKIDQHIEGIKRQLSSRESVLDWIKAYNTYMDFFALNFCKPANALGRAHVDDCLSTLRRINLELCPSTNGNVAAYVKTVIAQRFAVDDIPDGFLFFPMASGGLELRNPLISLQGKRDTVLADPFEILKEALEREQVEYRHLQKLFEKHGALDKHALPDLPKTFISEREFTAFRREYDGPLLQAWSELLLPANEEVVIHSSEMDKLLCKLDGQESHDLLGNVQQPYWRAVVELYGPEMASVFSGLQIVEKGLLPLGMLDLFKSKVRWDA